MQRDRHRLAYIPITLLQTLARTGAGTASAQVQSLPAALQLGVVVQPFPVLAAWVSLGALLLMYLKMKTPFLQKRKRCEQEYRR